MLVKQLHSLNQSHLHAELYKVSFRFLVIAASETYVDVIPNSKQLMGRSKVLHELWRMIDNIKTDTFSLCETESIDHNCCVDNKRGFDLVCPESLCGHMV